MISSYADLLKLLITVGPRLREIWPYFKAWVEATKALYDKVSSLIPNSTPGVLSSMDLNGETAELEIQVGLLVAGPNELFEGNFLRVVYQFLMAHPEIMEAALALIKRLITGS